MADVAARAPRPSPGAFSKMSLRRLSRALDDLLEADQARSALIAAVVAWAVYFVSRKPGSEMHNVYVLLADSFLQGRIDIPDPPSWIEVVRSGGRAYSHKGPLPAVLFMPFVALFGPGVEPRLITPLFGAGMAAGAWVLAGRIGLRGLRRVAAWVLPVLGTTLWYEAKGGTLWGTASVVAVGFVLWALAEFFGPRRPHVVGLLVGLAALCRPPMALALLGFAIALGPRSWVRLGLGAAGPLLVYAVYNLARFGTPTDMSIELYYRNDGYRLQRHPGAFSLAHVPDNVYSWLFLVPSFQDAFPYLRLNYAGQGLFLTSPALLTAFAARAQRWLWIPLVVVTLPAASFYALGATQFGIRYLLDTVPFFFALVCVALRDDRAGGYLPLLAASIAMNAYGVAYTNVFELAP